MTRIILLAAALFAAAPALAETPAQKLATPPAPSAKMAGEAQRLDLNSATAEQLMAVKGFDKPIAEAIIKGRPFRSVEDLAARKIVSAAVLKTVKDQLIVR